MDKTTLNGDKRAIKTRFFQQTPQRYRSQYNGRLTGLNKEAAKMAVGNYRASQVALGLPVRSASLVYVSTRYGSGQKIQIFLLTFLKFFIIKSILGMISKNMGVTANLLI